MNYYSPKQRIGDGRFDFCVMNDGVIRPVGYCHAYHPIPDEIPYMTPEMVKRENDKEVPFVHKYHDDGHATESEARACYKDYLLDHKLELNIANENLMQRCEICGEFTPLSAKLDARTLVLCAEHNTREIVSELYGEVGDTISSY